LVEAWEKLQTPKDKIPLSIDFLELNPIIVVWNDSIGLRLKNMGEIEDNKAKENLNGVGRLWNRYRDSVQKISMILAIARNQTRPEISASDLNIAEGMVTRSIEYMSELCLDSVADSEHQKNCQKVLSFIKKEKEVTQTKLCNNVRALKSKEIADVLDSLELQGKIEVAFDADPTKKKRSKIIRYL
jgi:hypothetical protein